ncbi:hypothetical protein [Solitalea canadensis]|uniref:hypothetical protein n=1 Tax=Solitalea canadensis TaxID=995 RepID=UPI000247234E|nr:hypothetical protein [Solitalea canadensis]
MQKSFGTWSRTKAQVLFAKPKRTPWAMYLSKSGVPIQQPAQTKRSTQFKTGDSKRKFFDALPAEFTRQQAVETGKQFQLSASTVDDILHNATGKALEKLKAGHYRTL